jgi:hypothetical protein
MQEPFASERATRLSGDDSAVLDDTAHDRATEHNRRPRGVYIWIFHHAIVTATLVVSWVNTDGSTAMYWKRRHTHFQLNTSSWAPGLEPHGTSVAMLEENITRVVW